MKNRRTPKAGILTVLTALVVESAVAQSGLVLTGTNYFQDFNSIEQGLPQGWTVRTGATATAVGTMVPWLLANSSPYSNWWANTAGKFGNHASTVSNEGTNFVGNEPPEIQSAATNRALGLRQTGTFADPGAAFVLKIQDTTGRGNFRLSIDMLMLSVQTRSTTWTIDYGIGDSPASFIPVGTYSDPGVFGATRMNISFGNALDNQSQPVWIRIVALTASTGSNNRDTFGIDNFSLSWEDITQINPVEIIGHPQSLTNPAGSTAVFVVQATGTGPLYYQWRKDGVDLLDDGAKIMGANLPTLYVSNVLAADMGGYSAVVTNAISSRTSQVATLTVIDPAIRSGPTPLSRTNMPGDTANFYATAAGTTPLAQQWYFNWTNLIEGATGNALNVTNVRPELEGVYVMVATNQFGAATSAPARLAMLRTPAQVLARWDFNNTNDNRFGPSPSIGTGTASIVGYGIGGTNAYFASGSFSDPAAVLTGTNFAWNTQFYPTNANQSNKMVGVQFNVSTRGYKDIMIAWEQRHSATASRYLRFQYSTNGTDFIDGPVITYTDTGLAFWLYWVDLSGVPGVANNPNFAWRHVIEFESTATGSGQDRYIAVSGNYGGGNTGGTIRYDLMTVYGNPVGVAPAPIPLEIQLQGTNVVLRWSDPAFWLESAPTVTGPYTKVEGATSPYTVPATGEAQFFRLRWQP
ncbi:MAG: immunoglobulin domain-containing protein [Verrucomicrobiales bacterium]|nr:immunoglobulin domain-containing protein [Verrucomicrobiales bacterium]